MAHVLTSGSWWSMRSELHAWQDKRGPLDFTPMRNQRIAEASLCILNPLPSLAPRGWEN